MSYVENSHSANVILTQISLFVYEGFEKTTHLCHFGFFKASFT